MNGSESRTYASPSTRVRLNVGGRRFETTVGTLTTGFGKVGRPPTFFSSLLSHGAAEDGEEELEEEQEGLKTAIRKQQSLLSSQLKSAFMAGHYDYAKMLFYQDDARTFERPPRRGGAAASLSRRDELRRKVARAHAGREDGDGER